MSQKSNIVLIGMPGAGKSTLGVVLAKMLRYDFVDGDLLIQKEHKQTLQEIINERGIDGFLQVENDVLAAIDTNEFVISTGGSAIYSEEAMRHLTEIGTVVYLEISSNELKNRLGDLEKRGVVLKGGVTMSLDELFEERLPYYQKWAEITISPEGLSITDSANLLIRTLVEQGAIDPSQFDITRDW